MAEYIEREGTLFEMKVSCRPPFAVVRDVPAANVVEIPKSGIGDLSDGYHTFNELYHHRAVLFSVICNLFPEKAWKSKLHDTGDMYDGMFIVGIETPQGQATYHYDINPYWDFFKVKELENAPKWDGHTPQDAIERLLTLVADVVEVRHGEWIKDTRKADVCAEYRCSFCGFMYCEADPKYPPYKYCPECGSKNE